MGPRISRDTQRGTAISCRNESRKNKPQLRRNPLYNLISCDAKGRPCHGYFRPLLFGDV